MGIISRLLLFLYVLAVLVMLAIGAGICLQIIPTELWQNMLNKIIARQETLAVLGAMLAASLCLLCVVFSGKKDIAERETDDVELIGGVLVAVEAVISVVERAALTVSGVREVHADVNKISGAIPMKIKLAMVLGQNYSAPQVSAKVSSAVNEALKVALEISEVPVEIKVTEITHAIAERERRVV